MSLTIQPQEVHFLAAGYSAQFFAYMNNVQLAANQVSWQTGTAENNYNSAIVIDANGVVRFRPGDVPNNAAVPVTAIKADDPSVTATAKANSHVAKMVVTGVPQIQASGGTQVSTLVTIDARVPGPQGPVMGNVTFYLRVPNRFNPDNRVPLCQAALAQATVETPGVRSSSASCVSSSITYSADIVIGGTYQIQVVHHGSAAYPKQGLFYTAPIDSTLVR